jgi:hypothetical protein
MIQIKFALLETLMLQLEMYLDNTFVYIHDTNDIELDHIDNGFLIV